MRAKGSGSYASAEAGKFLGEIECSGGNAGLDSAEVLAGAPEIRLGGFPA